MAHALNGKKGRSLTFSCFMTALVWFSVSVPVADVVGVKEGRVSVLPRKSAEDSDKDFTGGSSEEGLFCSMPLSTC